MTRYIDADALVKELERYDDYAIDIVNDQQTADVVEVVRCKDCIHHKNAPKTTDVWCERIDGLLQRNWFCADGERKEDG